MYHYNPQTALEELQEEALLPQPAHIRDMMVRAALKPQEALSLNRELQTYIQTFGEAQRTAKVILKALADQKS